MATVEMAGPLPPKLAEGEVMGVGVDVYRTDQKESDYQLFADGGSDGWYAYLQTPTGFVKYPGTFELAGTRLVFTVPWSAIGGRQAGRTSTFVDWSKALVAAANQSGGDRVPDNGTLDFKPA